ncbi:MAG: acyl-CoA dehydrogenase family protein [Victivallales bacterium]|nr:acyl-CoA dehydrogenase family protein [Victivallales bacterium]
MSNNLFSDNQDLLFHFANLDLQEISRLREKDYTDEGGPADFDAVKKLYREKLEEIGRISAEHIEPRAKEADLIGARFSQVDHKVFLPEAVRQNLKDIEEAHLTGVTLPRQYGGLNFPTTIYSMMTEIVSRADASLQNLFGLQSIAETVLMFGSDEQKAAVLPKFASGEWDGAMALTEPEAGSDLQSVQTKATLGEDGVWRLNGKKHFITNGMAQVLLVLARSEEGTKDGRGLSMFLVHPCPELVVNRIEHKLGIHASPTCELIFNNVPAELVGRRKMGLIRYVMSMMNGARLAISAQAVGLAEATRAAAWQYCSNRSQFGKKLCEIKPVWEMLTRIDALTAASRALLYLTCKYVDLRDSWNKEAERTGSAEAAANSKRYAQLADVMTPMTKAFNTESANQCAYDCIQCHGGKGYMAERPVERYYRDARIMNIYEGTTQMQVIAATAGIFKNSLDDIFAELDAFQFSDGAAKHLAEVNRVRTLVLDAQHALAGAKESMELLSRRIVRGQTIVLAALLLLKEATLDAGRMHLAERFIWEFLPEAEMHASIVTKSL